MVDSQGLDGEHSPDWARLDVPQSLDRICEKLYSKISVALQEWSNEQREKSCEDIDGFVW